MTDPELEGTAGHGRGSLSKIKDEVKFYPHQLTGVRTLARRTSFLLADEMGGGKAQPIGAPVLTPTGWRPIGALSPGDRICRPSGGTQRVLLTHPQGVIDVARVSFADGTSVLASWDHLWTVADALWSPESDDAAWHVVSTRDLYRAGLEGTQGQPRWEVPMTRPVDTTVDNWPPGLDPFTVGFVVAGGLSFESKSPNSNQIRIKDGRGEVAKQLHISGARVAYRESEDRLHAFLEPAGFRPDALTTFLADLEAIGITKSTSKRQWPEEIRFARQDYRFRFLLGVLAAAGEVDAAHQHRFGVSFHRFTSDSVIEGFRELVALLGGLTTRGDGGWVTLWWPTPLRLWSGTEIATPRPARYITGIAPAGKSECVCITVEDEEGLYITKHGIVTHNSLQALAVAAIDYELGDARKILIVCPTTVKDNWAAEIEEHTNFEAIVCNGTPKKRREQLHDFRHGDTDIFIMNYEQIPIHLDEINGSNIDILIFDEAHYLKTPRAKRTKACHNIVAKRSFLLTGSPMLNQPQELWSLLHRINPAEFPNFWKFTQRFCVFGGYQAKQVTGVKNRLELLEILDRYMLRRKKSEMIKLPPKNFVKVHVPLSPLQQRLYAEAEEELKLDIPNEPEPLELENAMVKILRLKQITGTPATLGFEDESIKLDRTIEIARELIADDDEKVVIFTQFRGVLQAIHERLEAEGLPVWSLHGDIKINKRIPIVHEWRDSTEAGVMLAMLQVAGVGINLTAASNVIFVDKLYTPAMNDQAVDRLHRLSMDKSKPVTIYEMLATKTVEERVEKILARKRKMNDEVIDNTTFRKMVVAALHADD
jgi:superfamily II DNA or RNA helicase